MPAQCIVTQLALRQKHRLRRRIALRHKGKGMAASITPRLGFSLLAPHRDLPRFPALDSARLAPMSDNGHTVGSFATTDGSI